MIFPHIQHLPADDRQPQRFTAADKQSGNPMIVAVCRKFLEKTTYRKSDLDLRIDSFGVSAPGQADYHELRSVIEI